MKTQQKVRLNNEYIATIKLLAKKYFDTDEVRIFGSRADLERKGGDIDIFVKTNKKLGLLQSKIAFLRDFELKHGEQKIDLIIQSGDEEKKIFKEAHTHGVRI
ncbi:MAG: nucleotidyltransferase domain-containing protein [Melioribacteraceae bacterium]|nr:nucleotidyltransferase domain-containing protein [Melioribacteraceae bacterium]